MFFEIWLFVGGDAVWVIIVLKWAYSILLWCVFFVVWGCFLGVGWFVFDGVL